MECLMCSVISVLRQFLDVEAFGIQVADYIINITRAALRLAFWILIALSSCQKC